MYLEGAWHVGWKKYKLVAGQNIGQLIEGLCMDIFQTNMICWTIGCAIWKKKKATQMRKTEKKKVWGKNWVNFWACKVWDFISEYIKNKHDWRQRQCWNMREQLRPLKMKSITQGRYGCSNEVQKSVVTWRR